MPVNQLLQPWEGKIHTAWGDGDPHHYFQMDSYSASGSTVAAPTPTNISTTVGRLVGFRYRVPIVVKSVRFFCIGTTANIYTSAIYVGTTRVWLGAGSAGGAIGTTANTWIAITPATPFVIPSNTVCWLGVGANAAGTTAGFRTASQPVPGFYDNSMPGNLAAFQPGFRQVALTAGAWPATLPALAATTAWISAANTTGTIPLFFLDSA